MLLKLMESLASESSSDGDGGEGTGNGARIKEAIAGGVFLCSVPPAGNDAMTKRFMKEVR